MFLLQVPCNLKNIAFTLHLVDRNYFVGNKNKYLPLKITSNDISKYSERNTYFTQNLKQGTINKIYLELINVPFSIKSNLF